VEVKPQRAARAAMSRSIPEPMSGYVPVDSWSLVFYLKDLVILFTIVAYYWEEG